MRTIGRPLSPRTDTGDVALGRGVVATGTLTGLAVGFAPGRWDGVILLGVAVVVVAIVGALLRGPAPAQPVRARFTGRQVLALAALYVAMASTLVFRQRSATELADDPLDLAGQFRVIMLASAFVLGCVAMLSRRLSLGGMPAAASLVLVYVAVVPLGALEAVSVSLVLFKWVELVTFVVVWLALTRAFPGDSAVPLRHFGIGIGILVAVLLVGIVLFPDRAIVGLDAVLPFQLRSHIPQMSANDVGTLGLIVLAFGLGRSRVSPGIVALGLAVVLAAQYRTGYVAALAMIVVWLVLRGGTVARVVLVALAVLAPIAVQSSTLREAVLRGDASAASVTTLTGRTVWWGEAIEVAERSRLVGLGLSSGVRFEVLQARFNGLTSTIHSTWVEAYVGVGLLGVGVLALAFLLAVVGALRRWHRDGALLPILLLTLLGVKSITGSTFEIGGNLFLLFLLTIAAAAERRVTAPSEAGPAEVGLVPVAG